MNEEIENLWNAIKGQNDDIRGLQIEVARLKVAVYDARATIEGMRASADPRAPILFPAEARRGS